MTWTSYGRDKIKEKLAQDMTIVKFGRPSDQDWSNENPDLHDTIISKSPEGVYLRPEEIYVEGLLAGDEAIGETVGEYGVYSSRNTPYIRFRFPEVDHESGTTLLVETLFERQLTEAQDLNPWHKESSGGGLI